MEIVCLDLEGVLVPEIWIAFAEETGIPELEDCSLVTATYRLSDNTHGTIGVIGPTRMQYGRVLSVLSAMGKQLTDLLRQDKE